MNQLAAPFLTAGFYYKTFMRPRFAWPAYEGMLRKFANGGRVSPDTRPCHLAKRHAHPDVLVALEPQESPWPWYRPANWPSEPSPTAQRRFGGLQLPIQLVPLLHRR